MLKERETDKELEESKYAKQMKEAGILGIDVYRRKEIKESRNGLQIVGRYRMGNETRANEYWKREEEKICRLCGNELETIKHVMEEYSETGRKDVDWREQINGDKKSIRRLNEINWARRRKNEEENKK